MTKKREYERVPMLGQLVGEVMVFEPMAVTQLSVKRWRERSCGGARGSANCRREKSHVRPAIIR